MQRRLNPLFPLILGQYSNFRGSQCIPRGYMDTRMTWIWCYSSHLVLVWFGRCFVAFISRYRYDVPRVRVSGRGFLSNPGMPIRSFPFFFRRNNWKIWVPLIFSGFRTLFRGSPANVMSAAMLWKARLCFLSIVVRITFEHKTKTCQPNANLTGDGTRSRPDLGTMQHSSITI